MEKTHGLFPVLDIDDMTWFSADHHFGHRSVLKFDRRPYADLDEMERDLVMKHNATVPPNGATVIFLGDVVYPKGDRETDWRDIVRSLHGDRKILLAGNHDASLVKPYSKVFDAVLPEGVPLTVRLRGREARCVHSPESLCKRICPGFDDLPSGYADVLLTLEYGNERIEGEWLCGHVHTVFRKLGSIVNVGVDAWDYAPVSVADAFALLDDPRIGIPGRKGFDGDFGEAG